jgi:hypothetical protein
MKADKIEQPETHFQSPTEVVKDKKLTHEDKMAALSTWEQDARQLLTASNEGMPGSDEGLDKEDHHRLGEVIRAKGRLASPQSTSPPIRCVPTAERCKNEASKT